tara:strand:+ start:54 stop:452 length:399 start_codon:yes stop_codon:yes gene_type:complete
MKILDWMRDYRESLIQEWARRPREIFEGETPTSRKEAKLRFKCDKLGGGPCELEGKHCAIRHKLALARTQKRESARESIVYFQQRDDLTCSTCKAGKARARLLKITIKSWQDRYVKQQQRRRQGYGSADEPE